MDELRDEDFCVVCGRTIVRYGYSYTLGRKDSAPVRAWDRWRHQDDNTLACPYETAS